MPLIVRWPGTIAPQSKTSHLAQTHDLAHTYVEAAGAKPMVYQDGRSLLPLFQNPNRSDWRGEILGAYYGGEILNTQRLLITRQFKYVFNGFDIDELYDLEHDREEMHNVAYRDEYHRQAEDMRARVYGLMAQLEDPYGDRPLLDRGFHNDRYGAARYLPRHSACHEITPVVQPLLTSRIELDNNCRRLTRYV